MREITIAITEASYHGNKGAAAMLQSAIKQLYDRYGATLSINLMSVYPRAERKLVKYDFVNVVSSKPERVIFVAFPLAVIYWLFRWLAPVRMALRKEKILRAYTDTDIVLDIAGVSFVDSRGFVMNTYAAICVVIPLLLGVPVVKYAQALGSFKALYNRISAKIVLPKMQLICARGEDTIRQLAEIGIAKNVKYCADGAFSMPDDAEVTIEVERLCEADEFYSERFVTLSLSSVVDQKCKKLGIDYRRHMTEFIGHLTDNGFGVLLIANAARLGSEKPRANDLPVCTAVYDAIPDKRKVRFYQEEMGPEKIRELIGRSTLLIGSRFHAMIAALERRRPVLLIGWSHKYKEILDIFGLGAFAVDYSNLSLSILSEKFEEALAQRDEIAKSIEAYWPEVLESSLDNIRYFSGIVEHLDLPKKRKIKTLNFNEPTLYLGKYNSCRMGYAADERLRATAASGGMVTALLCSLLRSGEIDGAWVTRSFVRDGKLDYDTFIATTEEEIKSCSGSIYTDIPQMKHVEVLSEFQGKVAVVMLPCHMRALNKYVEKNPGLSDKLALRICLYCSGVVNEKCIDLVLKKKKTRMADVNRIIFRRGHYRGETIIQKIDGSEQRFSYTKTICAYKNAYYFSSRKCLFCQDLFGKEADLSFGDVWLKSMKKNPIKHTSCLIHNQKGRIMYDIAVKKGDIVDYHFTGKKLLLSQKRGLAFKYNCAAAKEGNLDIHAPCRWNHRLAYRLARRNQRISTEKPEQLAKTPMRIIYLYMCFIRALLNF